jgi:hypothetical protein
LFAAAPQNGQFKMIPAKAIPAIYIFTVIATVARGTLCVSVAAPLNAPVSTESVLRRLMINVPMIVRGRAHRHRQQGKSTQP